MSGFFFCTGKLGSGKTLVAVGMMQEAINQGRKVATNVDLWMENLVSWFNRSAVVYRLPDRLSAEAFEYIGTGNDFVEETPRGPIFDESKNGLIVLDEGGLSMNSRDFREQGRQEFIRWCIHSRKRGWDVVIIVQHFEALDKQIRDLFGELVISCIRFDRMKIPFFGWLLQLVGLKGTLPGVHMATCRYGTEAKAPTLWRKSFRGRDLWFAYNTRQVYDPQPDQGVFQYLPPYFVKGRYHRRADHWRSLAKEFYETSLGYKVGPVSVFFCALALGWFYGRSGGVEAGPLENVAPDPVQQIVGTIPLGDASPADPWAALVPEEAASPWASAYISTFVDTGQRKLYRFRDGEGRALDRPAGASVIGVDPCHAVVKFDDEYYDVRCRS